MKKLEFKLCPNCGTKIFGVKRKDRNSYYYSPRCNDCAKKVIDSIKKLNKINSGKRLSALGVKPIGSVQIHKSGPNLFYRKIKTAMPNTWEYEHRIIAKAKDGEHVHHINGDTLDNRIENLVIMTPSEHSVHHHAMHSWSKKYSCCTNCSTTERNHMSKGLCSACYQRLVQYPKKYQNGKKVL